MGGDRAGALPTSGRLADSGKGARSRLGDRSRLRFRLDAYELHVSHLFSLEHSMNFGKN